MWHRAYLHIFRKRICTLRGLHARGTGLCPRSTAAEQQKQGRTTGAPKYFGYIFTHLAVSFIFVTMFLLSGTAVKARGRHVPGPKPPPPVTRGMPFPMTLADAVFLGLRNNLTIKSAYISRVSEKYSLYVEKTRFRPTATLSASQQWLHEGGVGETEQSYAPTATWLTPTGAQFDLSWTRTDTHVAGSKLNSSDTAELSLTQPLLKGGGIAVNMAPIRIAELEDRINRLNLKSTVSSTITEIIQAYRSLIEAQDTMKISKETLRRTQELLKTNQALVAAGRMAASEIFQTKATLASQKVSTLESEQALNSAQITLLSLLNMDLRTNIVAQDKLTPKPVSIDADEVTRIALHNRVDYLSQKLTLAEDKQSLIEAKNDSLWDLSVVGSLQYQRTHTPAAVSGASPTTTREKNASIGIQLDIPLGDASIEQEVVDAEQSVRSDENELLSIRQEIQAEVLDAVQNIDISWRQYLAAKEAQYLAQKNVDIEREKLKIGRASNFEVLSYETDLREANSELLSASISYLNALTTLDDQLGTTLDTWKIQLND